MNYSKFIQAFLSNGLCRTAVPLFFILSGFLYYKSFDGTWEQYKRKTFSRIRSLVIPYIFWSGIVFVSFKLAQQIPLLKNYFTTRNSADLSLSNTLYYVLIESYNSPLWYMKYLIVLSLLSIGLYTFFKRIPVIILLILFGGWFFNFIGAPISIPVRADALFFYSFGAIAGTYWSILWHYIEKILSYNHKLYLLIAYMTLLAIHSYRYCTIPNSYILEGYTDGFLDIVGKIGIVIGIFTICGLFYEFRDMAEWPWVKYSFLIFVMHHPIVNALKKILVVAFGGKMTPAFSLLVYLLSATITIFFILGFGEVVRAKAPRFYKMVCGGR